ncbi:hypothetical protein ABZ553_39985 [Streptomyces sparsogenes]|uniref:hypothetical protein n=1 Tax=Streptomyces sparsogenes TaxID=67365 RepID=UPI0033FAAC63
MNIRESGREPAGHAAHRRSWRKRRTPLALVGAAAVLAVTGTAPASAGQSDVRHHDMAEDSAGTVKSGPAPLPAPPQMREIDFLLGKYTCTYDVPGQDRKKTFYAHTTRKLGGHYYETETLIPQDNLRGRQTFGWNPVDGKYFTQFHDDWGSSGTTESPGAEDGVFTFTGAYLLVRKPAADGHAVGDRATVKDEIKQLGPGHYQDVQTLTFDNFTFSLSYDCTSGKAGHGE